MNDEDTCDSAKSEAWNDGYENGKEDTEKKQVARDAKLKENVNLLEELNRRRFRDPAVAMVIVQLRLLLEEEGGTK